MLTTNDNPKPEPENVSEHNIIWVQASYKAHENYKENNHLDLLLDIKKPGKKPIPSLGASIF